MPKAGPPRGDLLELVRTASPSRTKETENPQQEQPNMQGKTTQDSEDKSKEVVISTPPTWTTTNKV